MKNWRRVSFNLERCRFHNSGASLNVKVNAKSVQEIRVAAAVDLSSDLP